MADSLKAGVRYQVFSIKEIRENGGTKKLWVKAGSAWVNHDGASMNVYLDVLPLDGKLHIREVSPEQQLLAPPKPKLDDASELGTKSTV